MFTIQCGCSYGDDSQPNHDNRSQENVLSCDGANDCAPVDHTSTSGVAIQRKLDS